MTSPQSKNKVSQKAASGGRIQQIGGNYTNTTNISFWISFLLMGVLALGGLAWALNIAGWMGNSGNPQQVPKEAPALTK